MSIDTVLPFGSGVEPALINLDVTSCFHSLFHFDVASRYSATDTVSLRRLLEIRRTESGMF